MLDKNAVIQFKNGRIAILERTAGELVEFIIAYDDLIRKAIGVLRKMRAKRVILQVQVVLFFIFKKYNALVVMMMLIKAQFC